MSTIIYHPNQSVPPEYLDRHLKKGWRVTGQSVYNCNFLRLDQGEVISVLPTRLKLEGQQFGKRMRKLLRRNLSRFRVEYGPARWPREEEEYRVNNAYMAYHPSKSTIIVAYHVAGEINRRIFNTWQVRVYDGDRLIAYSYFDVGKEVAYGKAGIYDPAYGRHSLGLFTMCLEVEYCRRRGFDWYYPGYVSDDDPTFDYKHRIGPLEFYDVFSATWMPYASADSRLRRPLHHLYELLQAARRVCAIHGVAGDIYCYPYQDLCYSVEGKNHYLDTPLFLLLGQNGPETYLILLYDIARQAYELRLVKATSRLFLRRTGTWEDTVDYFFDPLRTVTRLATNASVEPLLPYFQLKE